MTENNEQKTRKSKKKKKISIIRILILIILLAGFIGAGVIGGWAFAIIKSAEPINPSNMYSLLDENSFIYDSKGKLIEKVESDGLRTIVKYDKIPQNLINAFIAIEDQDFFTHKGINPKRIIKALWEDIKAGAPVQGASTITQQLVKNLYLTNEKSIERKIKEVYYAFQLEQKLTKEQILEAYLNTVYLGSGAKGVQAAAYTYFSKDVSELDLAECAQIAGITKNPSKYSPLKTLKKEDVTSNHFIIDDDDETYTIVYNEKSKARQELVLKMMKNENMITEEEYNLAINEDIKANLKPGKKQVYGISSFFTDKVKSDVIEALMQELGKTEEEAEDMLYNQGLRIYSTIDLRIQKILENAYEDSKNFPNLIARKNSAGNILSKNRRSILLYKYTNLVNNKEQFVIPKGDYKYDQVGNLILFKGRRLNFTPLYENGQIKTIQISIKDAYKQNSAKEILIHKGGSIKISSEYKKYDSKKNIIISKEFLAKNPQFFLKDTNGNLLIAKENYSISNTGVVQPQSAMVIIDQHTGEIKALVGGREVKGRRLYNRAINPRQPGSSIKPIAVYTPAIDNGWTAADIIDDVPHYDRNGKLWPKNWYRDRFWGLSTLREGVQWSMNVMAVKIAEQIGIESSIDYLKKMGITTIKEKGRYNDKNLAAMALGGMTQGISPLEMTAAYGSLANDGIYIKPKSFIKVTDREGNIILENKSYKNRVVSPEAAFILTDMMKSVVTAGTGTYAKLDNTNSKIPVAGKTGTTSDNYDAWFVGYTPYYVGAVWIGNDVHMELSSGSKMSAKLWSTVMKKVHEGLPPKNFIKPENVISVLIDTESGKLPTDLSKRDPRGTVRYEYFIKGTEPKEFDDVHVELEIDTSTNKLATPNCPPTLVEKRVFIKRPIPYDPAQNNGIVPKDYIYEAPTEYCDIHKDNGNIIEFPSIPQNNPFENEDASLENETITEDPTDVEDIN
ncbi:PBP1A family penicillin-binding protein [Crassaminicella thermophila]|uniref:Penicillin-binding protein 1A n=1 Tax=Crassaminicella thermophila TaxID=2599308 RepID=A0A5C0SDU7_CRATE|nr:PBP1A family penicillin-binding protein [Crassaminicella thermophila]QEK12451.1 PBP1A family penicillin-binding protein [Crassaminicella thermophila]